MELGSFQMGFSEHYKYHHRQPTVFLIPLWPRSLSHSGASSPHGITQDSLVLSLFPHGPHSSKCSMEPTRVYPHPVDDRREWRGFPFARSL